MAAAARKPLEKYNLKSFKVLVADDDQNMRAILRSTLEAYGFHDIKTVANGAQAVKEFLSYRADLVITDLMMSPMDGNDVVRLIRTAPDSPDPYVPIIMLTGFAEKQRVFGARDLGVTAFLAKPITAGTLFARVIEIIENRRPFVAIEDFFGPDRRRRDTNREGEDRRKSNLNLVEAREDGIPSAGAARELETVRTAGGSTAAIATL